jgi:hypothetical protein
VNFHFDAEEDEDLNKKHAAKVQLPPPPAPENKKRGYFGGWWKY